MHHFFLYCFLTTAAAYRLRRKVTCSPMPRNSIQIQIEDLKAGEPQTITAEELRAIISNRSGNVKIIDLRTAEEFKEGHVQSSINSPFTDFQHQQMAEELKGGVSVVFVSLQSPDVDEFTARLLITQYQQMCHADPPSGSIKILSGGFSNWQNLFGSDSSLVSRG